MPIWITSSFPIIRIIILILIAICSLILSFIVLIQPQKSEVSAALGGQTTGTFYAQNKTKNIEGLLIKLTIIFSIAIALLSILFFVTVAIYPVGLMA